MIRNLPGKANSNFNSNFEAEIRIEREKNGIERAETSTRSQIL
jgi:hypothetical protein